MPASQLSLVPAMAERKREPKPRDAIVERPQSPPCVRSCQPNPLPPHSRMPHWYSSPAYIPSVPLDRRPSRSWYDRACVTLQGCMRWKDGTEAKAERSIEEVFSAGRRSSDSTDGWSWILTGAHHARRTSELALGGMAAGRRTSIHPIVRPPLEECIRWTRLSCLVCAEKERQHRAR